MEEKKENLTTNDEFSNSLFRLGFGSQSPTESTEYISTRRTDNYALLNNLYRENWVVQNVVGLMVDDMLREWYTVKGDLTPEQREKLTRAERKTRLREKLSEGLMWGRLYGGAAGLILIRGHEKRLQEPLDFQTVLPESFKGLYIIDRWCGITPEQELITDINDTDFGLPKYYRIENAQRQIAARVHHSRIIRFVGRELPYYEKMSELYWGASEIESIYKDVVNHDNVTANMAALTFRANIDTMEIENLPSLFSTTSGAAQKRFWDTMQAQSVLTSNFGLKLVNKGDKLTNQQYSFAGLPDVYNSMCLNLCGASHYPMTKLFGRSPDGLNATGESDLKNYYDYVDTQRESKLRPVLYKLLPVMLMSACGEIPDGLDIAFPPLWTPTAAETASIAKTKTDAIIAAFQAGLIHADTATAELKQLSDGTGLFAGIKDEEIANNKGKTYQDVTALRDPLSGLV